MHITCCSMCFGKTFSIINKTTKLNYQTTIKHEEQSIFIQ